MNNFINNHYQIYFKGAPVDLNHLDKAEEFLLIDNHQNFAVSLINSEFINQFFKDAKVYVEAQPLGNKVKRELSFQGSLLKPELEISGWDTSTTCDLLLKVMKSINPNVSDEETQSVLEPIARSEQLSYDYHVTFDKLLKNKEDADLKIKVAKIFSELDKNSRKIAPDLISHAINLSFMDRQISLIKSLDAEGKKVLLAGELHLARTRTTMFHPRISIFEDEGRQLVYEKLASRNAVILGVKPEIIEDRMKTIRPLEEEIVRLAASMTGTKS